MSNRSDRWHRAATLELARLQQEAAHFILHDGIRIELLDTLSSLPARHGALAILDTLARAEARGEATILPLDRGLLDSAVRMFAARRDKEWGLTDCISFVLMRRLEVYEAMTCDDRFVQAGFIRLLSQP